MRKKYFIPIIIILSIAILAILGVNWWRINSSAVSNDSKEVDFLILKGRSAAQIGETLFKEGLIKNPLAFKIYVQVTGKAEKIQAGEFMISPNLDIAEIVDRLSKGPVELWITVPEGLRREEIVEKFILGLEMGTEQQTIFRNEFLAITEGKEGYLFPDTYLFPRDATAALIVKRLSQTFDEKTSNFNNDIEKSGYSKSQLITLASLLERETITDTERPVVAGILFKRLNIGWPLQVDATVQYAIANNRCRMAKSAGECEWWPILTLEDLDINSAYNSYKFQGLPPAPIANPGLSSIEAVVNPEDSEYLYYIHDPDGVIHYARNLSEHNSNVKKYLGKD